MKTILKTFVITGIASASILMAAPQAKAAVDLQIEAPDSGDASDAVVADVASTPVLDDPAPIEASPNQVPEPTTLALAALGATSLALLRRRK